MQKIVSVLLLLAVCLTLFCSCGAKIPNGTSDRQLKRYNIFLVDENGRPVKNAVINICTDTACAPKKLENTNYFGFDDLNGATYPFIIHIIQVPDGYIFDTDQSYEMDEAGDTLTVTVPHA